MRMTVPRYSVPISGTVVSWRIASMHFSAVPRSLEATVTVPSSCTSILQGDSFRSAGAGGARRERGELGARGVQRLLHFVEDEKPAVARLLECLLEDLRRDAADLDVHLEGRDARAGARDLEVHVAVVRSEERPVGK